MKELTAECTRYFFELLRKRSNAKWFSIVSSDRFYEDFKKVWNSVAEEDVEYFIEIYTEIVGDVTTSNYENENAFKVQEYKFEKTFLGLEKSSLEFSYKKYLKQKFYSEAIETSILIMFLGHEHEAFKMAIKDASLSMLDSIFNSRKKLALMKAGELSDIFYKIYDLILAPIISIDYLKTLLDVTQKMNGYVNPNVITILERASENGKTQFNKC